jgi:hypothetical protein
MVMTQQKAGWLTIREFMEEIEKLFPHIPRNRIVVEDGDKRFTYYGLVDENYGGPPFAYAGGPIHRPFRDMLGREDDVLEVMWLRPTDRDVK